MEIQVKARLIIGRRRLEFRIEVNQKILLRLRLLPLFSGGAMKAIGMNRHVLEMLLDRLDLEPEEDALRGVIEGVTEDIIVTEISPLYPYVATSGLGVKVEVTTAAM